MPAKVLLAFTGLQPGKLWSPMARPTKPDQLSVSMAPQGQLKTVVKHIFAPLQGTNRDSCADNYTPTCTPSL